MGLNTARVVVYIPEKIMEKLRETYSECKTDSEILVKMIMEFLANWTEHRQWDSDLTTLARSYLMLKYKDMYPSSIR